MLILPDTCDLDTRRNFEKGKQHPPQPLQELARELWRCAGKPLSKRKTPGRKPTATVDWWIAGATQCIFARKCSSRVASWGLAQQKGTKASVNELLFFLANGAQVCHIPFEPHFLNIL